MFITLKELILLSVVSTLKKQIFLLMTVFFFGCNSADDVQYSSKLDELKEQERRLKVELSEQKQRIDLQQKERQKQFVQFGGTEEEFEKQLALEKRMSTEEIIQSTEALKKQIEDQKKLLSSLEEEAAKAK